ncbi:MAG: sigma-70 family RNA polymerase sigma factor [Acidimicrobiaceae bacterium]|nr:sigma-70 family RNA polymerase sigma factor [Acidimicrobiaceae bacterium]MBO0748573.1 sigma-70 family RNA polymerase sigma factor [Acidimicrobiaceae bacterium]
MPPDARVRHAWENDRGYLLAIASGMLGRASDAEDVVQEAFARLTTTSVEGLDDVRGWLVVVTRRLCLDRLRSAESRRTTATSLPPEVAIGGIDPADRLTLDDEVRQALEVVLSRLSPGERTSFILHDVFGFPFDAIADLVGRTPAACRQLARRARLSISAGSFDPRISATKDNLRTANDLAERFVDVCQGGDLKGLVDLLDPDVSGTGVVIGVGPRPVVRGADDVAERTIFNLGPQAHVSLETFPLEAGSAVLARGEQVLIVVRLDERDGRIVHLHAVIQLTRRPR